MLADTTAVESDWLVALRQEGGRGRHGRPWESIEGNFFGSTLIQLRPDDPPAPSLALAAGLALIEAVEVAAPNAQLALKWPNDLMLGDAKLAGILLERSGDRVVAGFGVNLAGAPQIPGRKTAALSPAQAIAPQVFAPLIAGKFSQVLALWRTADPSAFSQAWMARAHPIGTTLEVHSGPGERVSGSFDGIERDGAMRLKRKDGMIDIIRAGDVSLG
ncbi:biotin--[acetyl-CoA-carboxylase] ligase [Sphingomonas sp. G124]|uniref:Biotin--[acetyl-CoA-carboxylase] ligase n=1 Tax=Sphingomonas cremea TaxID=2904799 RepID=A0A9X1QIX6_9SPHN|nr:biotin--[acetyl-CoA-carboxylase] ligase [Sphingomonas cremea]